MELILLYWEGSYCWTGFSLTAEDEVCSFCNTSFIMTGFLNTLSACHWSNNQIDPFPVSHYCSIGLVGMLKNKAMFMQNLSLNIILCKEMVLNI